jgi:hypothetical protein
MGLEVPSTEKLCQCLFDTHRTQIQTEERGFEREDCGMLTVFGYEQNEEWARI